MTNLNVNFFAIFALPPRNVGRAIVLDTFVEKEAILRNVHNKKRRAQSRHLSP